MSVGAVILDFDGTIVDSNGVKGQAFRQIFRQFGSGVAEWAFGHHCEHLGRPRVEKIEAVVRHFALGSTDLVSELSRSFGIEVEDRVAKAPLIRGFACFSELALKFVPLFVASATPQEELERIITARRMTHLFAEVFGYPTSKSEAVRRVCSKTGTRPQDVLFIGDSEADEMAALSTGTRFASVCSGLTDDGVFGVYEEAARQLGIAE